ncbi:hypothetical protein L7F22_008635 [Adiantum nelumboides]|nr:hypothetical protein [Adiantum nelumboides]
MLLFGRSELACHQSAHSFSEVGDNGTLTVMYMFDILNAPCTSSFQLDGCGEAHDVLQELFNVSVPEEDEGEAVILDSHRHFHVAQAATAHSEAFEGLSYAHPPDHHTASEVQPFLIYGSILEVVGCPKPLLQLIRNPISLEVSEHLRALIEHVWLGLDAGHSPVLSLQGSGGVYFMKDECI